jgi:DNA-binding NarL/FixJ family response regulator
MSDAKKIKVAIVEDNRTVREELALQVNDGELTCIAQVSSGEEALKEFPAIGPDVVLLDIELSGELTGLDCIAPLKEKLPRSQIVMLTIFNDPQKVFAAIQRGADGYLQKSSSRENLIRSIRDVWAGGAAMSPEIARLVLSNHRKKSIDTTELEKLTAREKEIATCIAYAWEQKEIAEYCGISPETVKSHVKSIYRKLAVSDRASARRKLFPNGY